jgi:hypothetical protein
VGSDRFHGNAKRLRGFGRRPALGYEAGDLGFGRCEIIEAADSLHVQERRTSRYVYDCESGADVTCSPEIMPLVS